MELHIRKASKAESPLLTSIIRQSFKDVAEKFNLTPENCPTHGSFVSEEKIQREFEKNAEFYIIKFQHIDCGCVELEFAKPKVCYLEKLAVIPEYRNKGLGEKLVHHCYKRAREKGCARIEIGIIAEQKDLQRWYEKLGFIFDRQIQFKHLPFFVTFMFIDLFK